MKQISHKVLSAWYGVINESAIKSEALCIALFHTNSRNFLFGNKAFLNLSKGDPALSLINPDFNTLAENVTSESADIQNIFEGLLTIGDEKSLNTTIQARVFEKQGQILVVGEIDLFKINQQHQILTGLNREVSNLQRQLTKEKIQLERALNELKKANNELAILNAEKNRFLNMAAHDLRNPISTAISYADLLIRDRDSYTEEQRILFLRKMEDRLQFAIRLMTELLDVSKIEAGTVELDKREQDFTTLIRQVVEFNQLIANYKNINIDLHTGPGKHIFPFDKNKMEQVLNNIISNAIKYSPHNSHIIVHVDAGQHTATVSVKDNGPGIKPEELPLVFEPFQKTSNKPTAGESSTGLGLAISKKIVEQHGGSIHVDSESGRGSVFYFSIPVY